MNITYRPDIVWVGDKTIYVYVDGIRIGWIAARQDYEWGKIYFCYNPEPKIRRASGPWSTTGNNTMTFGEVSRMEDWIRENVSISDWV